MRWALILLGTIALTLGGCGRKGPLDLPPSATAEQRANAVPDPNVPQQANQPNLFNPNAQTDALPTAGKGPKRPFVLDPLLN